jgi:hypothetical protein
MNYEHTVPVPSDHFIIILSGVKEISFHLNKNDHAMHNSLLDLFIQKKNII